MRYLMHRQHDGRRTRVGDARTRWSSALLLLFIFDVVLGLKGIVVFHFCLRHVQ